jgi:hypothetical protein
MVQFETNRYSVPTDYAHETVLIKAFERRIQIIKADKGIASHQRLFSRHDEAINPYHFLALLEKKSRAVDHAVVMRSFAGRRRHPEGDARRPPVGSNPLPVKRTTRHKGRKSKPTVDQYLAINRAVSDGATR